MQIAVSDWHNKAKHLIKALTEAGHMVVDRTVVSDALLMDTDFPVGNYRNVMGFQRKHGTKIFLYSHGANAFLGWDGIWTPQKVDGYFCMAEGVKEVMGMYNTPYPYPIYNIGWHFCEMLISARPDDQARFIRALASPLEWLSFARNRRNERAHYGRTCRETRGVGHHGAAFDGVGRERDSLV
jgi:hypothetical protein